jgi:hypothetical protein
MGWAKEEKVEMTSMLQMKMVLTQLAIHKTLNLMAPSKIQKHT